jgi:hypothetical protein
LGRATVTATQALLRRLDRGTPPYLAPEWNDEVADELLGLIDETKTGRLWLVLGALNASGLGHELDDDEADPVVVFGLDDALGTAKAARGRLRGISRRGRVRVLMHDVVAETGDEVRVVSVMVQLF